MDKQKRQAIYQMILAAFMCAAVVIPAMVAVDAATQKEQAAQVERDMQSEKAVVDKIAAVKATVKTEPEVLSYYDSIPLNKELQNYIIKHSRENGIDPAIIMAMIDRESDFDSTKIGDNGQAYGLMQIWVKWHYPRMLRLGCTDLLNPYHNVTVGIDYLCEQLNKYNGDIAKALVGYNGGAYEGVVTEYAKSVLAAAERLGEADVLYR